MSSLPQRQTLLPLIREACDRGARLASACRQIGLTARTVQRWLRPEAYAGDHRVASQRVAPVPANKYSDSDRQAALTLLNSDAFKDLPPSQIVPRLADQGRYLASESSLYRWLRVAGQMTHRRLERAPHPRTKPRALVATQPDQIYCWDITYLPTPLRGTFFYWYLFVDVFSRKIVGWQVFDCERAELASQLLLDLCQRQGIVPGQLTVHSDNGAPMKGETLLATMQRLGIAQTRSRPAVSNDNPYSEALFRTLKYRPQLPIHPFDTVLHARRWATELVLWYNGEHRHSAIRFVTPDQRHAGLDRALLRDRANVYQQARQANPQRWSTHVRNWQYIDTVHLNPDTPKKTPQ